MADETAPRGETPHNPDFDKYDGLKAMDLIKVMAELKARKDALDAELSEVNKHYDFVRINKIPEAFDNEGITNIRVDGIGRVNLRGELQVQIPAGARQDAHLWLRDTGHGDIVSETVNSSTLKAFAKEMLRKGEALPDNLFKVHPYSMAVITKA